MCPAGHGGLFRLAGITGKTGSLEGGGVNPEDRERTLGAILEQDLKRLHVDGTAADELRHWLG